jgi:hypothetical protein
MSTLYAWQKLDWVLPGARYGTGSAGSATISSDPNVRVSFTGNAGDLSSTVSDTTLTNGKVVMLRQEWASGAGNWEWNMVASGGGTTTIHWSKPLHYTYVSGAQVIEVPSLYTTAAVHAFSVPGWNGSTGGVAVIVASLSINSSGVVNGSGVGFRGGNSGSGVSYHQYSTGEGTGGPIAYQTTSNGNGGGGPLVNNSVTSGGGGGHANVGGQGSTASGSGTRGDGGSNGVDSDDGTAIVFGGGGGGSGRDVGGSVSNGGIGGGIVILVSRYITQSAGPNVNGGNSGVGSDASGGAGAGGYVLYICETADLGSGLTTAGGGTPYGAANPGGSGSVGKIAVHHSGTVTGTTTPTFVDVTEIPFVPGGAAVII